MPCSVKSSDPEEELEDSEELFECANGDDDIFPDFLTIAGDGLGCSPEESITGSVSIGNRFGVRAVLVILPSHGATESRDDRILWLLLSFLGGLLSRSEPGPEQLNLRVAPGSARSYVLVGSGTGDGSCPTWLGSGVTGPAPVGSGVVLGRFQRA